MDLTALGERAMAVRAAYAAWEQRAYGRAWTREELALGFVGDVGDLAKLVLANEGVRHLPEAKERLAHELADCLWSVLVLARLYDIDLEPAFLATMDTLAAELAARAPVAEDSA